MAIRWGLEAVVKGVAAPGLVGTPESEPEPEPELEERSRVWMDSWDPSIAAAELLGDFTLVVNVDVAAAAAAACSASISKELRVMISIPSPVTITLRPTAPVPPAAVVAAVGGRVGVE